MAHSLRLSSRLAAVASLIPAGSHPADVGADHGQLPLFLVKSGQVERAEAIENKEGPFATLRQAVAEAGEGQRVHCVFADGISRLDEGVDGLSLCGMGGRLIAKILLAHPENLAPIRYIVCDAHREGDFVRRTLVSLGYRLAAESVVFEQGIHYFLMRYEKGEETHLEEADFLFGHLNRAARDPAFLSYLEERASRCEELLSQGLSESKREEVVHLLDLYRRELEGSPK